MQRRQFLQILGAGSAAGLAPILQGCGGKGNPMMPTTTLPPAPGNGTVLTFVSGDLDVGITGVTVNVPGSPSMTTDADGRVMFGQILPAGASYDAMASGYLPRNSMIRNTLSSGQLSTRLSLVPIRSGFDETFIQQLMFSEFMPGRRLSRPAQNIVYLRLSDEIVGDALALENHRQAAQIATNATQQAINFIVSDAPPTGVVVYDMSVNGGQTSIGLTTSNFSGNKMTGGRITYRTIFNARQLKVVTHELGHVLGFGHPTGQLAMMNPNIPDSLQDFTSAEKLALHIYLFQRFPGTVWPDNDRNAQVLSSQRNTIVIGCGH